MATRFKTSLLPAILSASLFTLGGCALSPPPSQADQADLAACTSQADASYNAQNYEALSRTDQTGVRFSATPTQVFEGQQLGLEHQRDSQISDCVNDGTVANNNVPGKPLPAPQILTH